MLEGILVVGFAWVLWELRVLRKRVTFLMMTQLKAAARITDHDRRVSKRMWEMSYLLESLHERQVGGDYAHISDVDEVMPSDVGEEPIEPVDWKGIQAMRFAEFEKTLNGR